MSFVYNYEYKITSASFSERISSITGSGGTTTGSFTGSFTGSLQGTASFALQAANSNTININSFGSDVESYLLMSNVIATPGVAIGGDSGLRYNASTNRLTVGTIGATSFTGSLLGTASYANNALSSSFATTSSFSTSSSFTTTASFATTSSFSTSSSFALSASFAPTNTTGSFTGSFTGSLLAFNAFVSRSLTVGSTITSSNIENTLNVYPPPAGGTGEGGQILLAASGGLYTSASMLDTWQDNFRLLRGSNTGGSNAALIVTNLQSGNTNFAGAITASAYSGLPNSWLSAARSGNQTIDSGTWANRDIIFNNISSIGFTYNSTTGIATLQAGKTYRITARLAWSAAGLYTLKFRIFNHTTGFFTGPTVEMIQSPNGTFNVSDNTLETIFVVGASDTNISIRTTSDTNALSGEFIRGDLNTQLIIQQIA